MALAQLVCLTTGSLLGIGAAVQATLASGWRVDEVAHPRHLVESLTPVADALQAVWRADCGPRLLLVEAGSVDLYHHRDARQTALELSCYCHARRAAGWTTLVTTILPRADFQGDPVRHRQRVAAFEQERSALNTLLRIPHAAWNGRVDLAALPIFDDGPVVAADGLTLGTTARPAVLPAIRDAVTAQLAQTRRGRSGRHRASYSP